MAGICMVRCRQQRASGGEKEQYHNSNDQGCRNEHEETGQTGSPVSPPVSLAREVKAWEERLLQGIPVSVSARRSAQSMLPGCSHGFLVLMLTTDGDNLHDAYQLGSNLPLCLSTD